LIHKDLDIETNLETFDLSGRIVLRGSVYNFVYQYPSYIWDLDENIKLPLTINNDQTINMFSISPDRELIALKIVSTPINRPILRIVNYSGEQVSNQDITDKDWFFLIGWYDNENVLFSRTIRENNLRLPGPIVIYNPFTEEVTQELSIANFPDAATWVPFTAGWGWGEFTEAMAVYSPGYRFVVYYQDSMEITLRDILKKDTITTLNPGWDTGPPRWISNGEALIIDMFTNQEEYLKGNYCEELFRVNIDGSVEQLTYLTNTFDEVNIKSFRISPDNRYIAFWLNTNSTIKEYKLALFDIQAKEVWIYDNILIPISESYAPVWSPSSNQIMVFGIEGEQGKERNRTILIDLEEYYAIELALDVLPVGWIFDETP
jgi:hypothetical protein